MRKNIPVPGRLGAKRWAWQRLARSLVGTLAVSLAVAACGLLAARAEENGGSPPGPSAPAVTVLRPSPSTGNSLILHAGRGGYVSVDASVNGTPIRMAFDTGASAVSLTEADAARIGVSGGLHYTIPFSTANGRAYGALVTLREIRIGKLEIDNVKAVVMPNLDVSLLGQSFLNRLQSYQMRDGVLTLTW